MSKRTKTCPQCGERFSYDIGKGNDRVVCSAACRNARKAVQKAERLSVAPRCTVQDCSNKQVGKHGLCEMHYARRRSTGSLHRASPKHRYKTGAGYIKVLDRAHPIADAGGYVYEHRKIMYDTHGGDCPCCVWCGVDVDWRTAVVDHLNEAKDDNDPSNLVVACSDCNRARGAVIPFIRKLDQRSFELLVKVLVQHIRE